LTDLPFSSLSLDAELLKNLSSVGYDQMTPIQAQSLPPILAGKDVIAQGKTGSGKTAAFGLGLLMKLKAKTYNVQSLVLCPTRELADQVAKEIRKLARTISNVKTLTLCGGAPFGPQASSISSGAQIIIGTPGRVADHLRKGTLKLSALTTLVLDEADRMLDMGFQETLDEIIEQTPKERQTLLFSATFPSDIRLIAERVMNDPVIVQVEITHNSDTIQQHFYQVRDEERMTALRTLLLQHRPESAVVFCDTRRETQQVADLLTARGFSVLALHGDFDQRDRNQILVQFSNKSVSILVASDVAARGLDIDSLDAVINYRIAPSPTVHLHRIGRTGRAGSTGLALTLFSENDSYKIALLQESIGQTIVSKSLPPSSILETSASGPLMATLQIDGGKRQKVRPSDILGALTGTHGIAGSKVGKIDIFDHWAYVAISRDAVTPALKKLGEGKLKGRSFRVRAIN
jgi:ATP-independent RNA helicase DbpA